jgi:Trk-type K+ transport system membrane component
MTVCLSLAVFFLLVYEFGFQDSGNFEGTFDTLYTLILWFFIGVIISRMFLNPRIPGKKRLYKRNLLMLLILVYQLGFSSFLSQDTLLYAINPFLLRFLAFFIGLVLLSGSVFTLLNQKVSPHMLFVYSFLIFIFIGTGLLLLPNATLVPISFLEALFTSTSAVCVSGLNIVEIATVFSLEGKLIILFLIQIGGIGVMTFTSFFALLFMSGDSSFRSQMLLKDILSENRLSLIVRTLRNIVLITLIIELFGALSIWFTVRGSLGLDRMDEIFFSLFHSVSAFCNAGFSILPGNLNNPLVFQNFPFQFFISVLVILGGLGFPILFNYGSYLQYRLRTRFRKLMKMQSRYEYKPHILGLTSRIVLISTLIFVLGGTLMFLVFEYHNALDNLSWGGKIISAFFNSVTTRTAGFNNLDLEILSRPSMLLFLFLMWVGASPMSTAGGIKTTTLAIVLLSILGSVRKTDRLEMFHREISRDNIHLAHTIVLLSLFIAFVSVFLLVMLNPAEEMMNIVFEVFSALGTVGLSLNLTPFLSPGSHFILIVLMFVGRVGAVTLLSSLFSQRQKDYFYRYPNENIIM